MQQFSQCCGFTVFLIVKLVVNRSLYNLAAVRPKQHVIQGKIGAAHFEATPNPRSRCLVGPDVAYSFRNLILGDLHMLETVGDYVPEFICLSNPREMRDDMPELFRIFRSKVGEMREEWFLSSVCPNMI